MLYGFSQDKDQTMSSEVVRTGIYTGLDLDSDGFRNWLGGFSSGIVWPLREDRPGLSAGYWICRKLDLKTVLVRNWIEGEVDCTGDYYLIVGIGFVSAFSDGLDIGRSRCISSVSINF
jgi:hypothetical protein